VYFRVLSASPEPLSLISVLAILPSTARRKLVLWGRRLASELSSILGAVRLEWFRIPDFRLSISLMSGVLVSWSISVVAV